MQRNKSTPLQGFVILSAMLKPSSAFRLPLFVRTPTNALVILLLLAMVALWTIACGWSHRAPDLDGMEELVWAASLELGYTKHPPLPSWFMYVATGLFGRPVWLAFFMGQLFSALGLWFVWKLGCEFGSRRRALMATLLVSVTAYFSLRGTIYNHNTVQLWSIAASIWLFYRVVQHRRRRDWAWLGFVCGLAMLTKYSALVQFTAFFLYLLRVGALRDTTQWKGIGLAFAVFIATISPHLWWLAQHHFEPVLYAEASLQDASRWVALRDLLFFSLDQAGRMAPMLIALGGWALWYRRKGNLAKGHAANDAVFHGTVTSARYFRSTPADIRQFLLWVGLTPLVATLLMSSLLGTRLEASWASTFFVLYGFYGMWWLRGEEAIQLRRVLALVAALHLMMAVGYGVARGPLAYATGHMARSTYPGPTLAALAKQHWQAYQPGRPLRVVVSNTWMGGNIAIHASDRTQVYINASDAESPWFAPGTALQCGALIAYSEGGRAEPSDAVRALYDQAPWKGVDEVRWSGSNGVTIDFHWAVVPATPDCLRARRP